MNCDDMRGQITEYANGELTGTRKQFVEEHLTGCPICQTALADDNRVRGKLTDLRTMPEPLKTINIRNSTMTTIKATNSRPLYKNSLVSRGLIAASVAAIFAIVLVIQLSGTGSSNGIAAVYAATSEVDTFNLSGTTRTISDSETIEASFEWAFLAPDTFQGTITSGETVIEIRNVGDRQYSRDLGAKSDGVVVITTASGFNIFNPIQGTQSTLDILDSLDMTQGPDTVIFAGKEAEYYVGDINMDRMVEKQLDAMGMQGAARQEAMANIGSLLSSTISLELWVNPDTSQITRMKLDGRIPTSTSSSDGSSAQDVMIIVTDVTYDYPSIAPDISAPTNAQGQIAPGWRRTQ